MDKSGARRSGWLCQCDCGNTKTVRSYHLTGGKIQSCGCLSIEAIKERTITHGGTKTRLFRIWQGMKNRCNNPNVPKYQRYGARGIRVCDEWANSFAAFRDWALENGYADDLSIDRIDNDGDYCPDNCRWATRLQQANNTSANTYVECDGETHTLADWARIFEMSYNTLLSKLYKDKIPFQVIFNEH